MTRTILLEETPPAELWRKAAKEITPLSLRRKVLARFSHGHLAPGGIENMSRQELRKTFGDHTVARYLSDNTRRRNKSYRGDAGSVLSDIVNTEEALNKISISIERLTKLADKQAKEQAPELSNDELSSIKAYIQRLNNERTMFEQFNISDLQKSVAQTRVDTESLLQTSGQGYSEVRKIIRGNIRSIKRHFDLLSLKPLIVLEKKQDKLASQIVHILGQNKDLDERDRRLICAKNFSNLKVFNEEDLLLYLVGGKPFLTRTKNLIEQDALKRKGRALRSTSPYSTFMKDLPAFMDKTAVMVLFSFSSKKPIEQWGRSDIAALSKYSASRYQLAHDVIYGLADPEQNPHGEAIDAKQAVPLIHEVLRSALYPEYKVQIRLGYGGTDKNDVLARSAGYVMNALDIIRIFSNASEESRDLQGINRPVLSIVSADQLSAAINKINPDKAKQTGTDTLSFVKSFVEEFYPDIAEHVTYEQPEQETIHQSPLYNLVVAAAKEVAKPSSKTTLETKNAINVLESFAQRHTTTAQEKEGSLASAIHYVAGHLMPAVFATVKNGKDSIGPVWKIGSKSEGHFNVLQQAVRETLVRMPTSTSIVNAPNAIGDEFSGLFTTTAVGGRPPPYYKDSESYVDSSVSELAEVSCSPDEEYKLIRRIRIEKSGAASDLRAMLSHPRLGQGDVQKGWSKFRDFLKKQKNNRQMVLTP